ncbi:unnamed protein product [Fraxinus pennsylvanica]|uniref:Uncharacterized protein n=1 Tax=Fraxinus pennsylvanica TaxID=56036 RepID=A0AAD2DJ36_9LAMI|nr:unnamed protein product [Fraxinus pennsylvanica]
MGLLGSFVWVQNYGKKQCRRLFWKMRAATIKAVKNRGKQQVKFQYDPSSYALNFDDGSQQMGSAFHQPKFQDYPKNTIWIYVIWVENGNGAIEIMSCHLPIMSTHSIFKE